MHSLLGCLEFHGHVAYDLLYVDGVVYEGVGCRVHFGVGVVVDGVGKLCEFAVYLLLPLLHGFGEVLFREGGVGVGIAHCFKLLHDGLSCRCLG